MDPRKIRHLAAVAFSLGGAVVAAQQAQPPPVFRSRVDAIEIEMRVFGRDGGPVTDLSQTEVEVLEDGRRQEILAFSRVTVPTASPARAPAARPASFPPADVSSNRAAAASRVFVLILDDLHVDSRNTPHVKEAARRFVERHVQPGDLVSVVYTGVRPDAAQDFTSNRNLLFAAIDKFVGRKLRPATLERMEQYNTFYRARGRPRFEDLRDPQDAERAFNARSAMASIESVSGVLARVSGRRKAALLFTEGLDYDLSGLRSRGRLPGAADGPTILPTTAPTGGSEADAVGRPDVHSYTHDVLLSLQAAMGAASRANVALYPIDVHGDTTDTVAELGAPVEDGSLGLTPQHVIQEMRDAQETLSVLATNTGGFATLSPSHYDAAFARIVRESSEYYLLAYSPWNPAPDGTFRDLTVRVTRPGVRVTARRGYYAPRKPVKRPLKFVGDGISEETSAVVMAPIPSAGLLLDVHAVAFRRDRKHADVIVTAHVDGPDLAHAAASDVTNTLELALMATDSAGRVQAATARAIEVRLDDSASRMLRDGGYRVVSRVQLPPGRYQIRQAVRERNGGRSGSVFSDLVVPDYSKGLGMSGILLTSRRANAVPTSVDPDTYERLAVLPSVRRSFEAHDELIALAEVYDTSRQGDLEVITTLTDGAGAERYRRVTKVPRADLKAADGIYRHAVQVPLRSTAGDLMLSVEARPAGSGNGVVARVAFSVESPSP